MHSRLGIASFVLGVTVGVAYAVLQVLLHSAPTALVALTEYLAFLIGATALGITGLVLGIVGWVRAGRSNRKNGFAILGSALCLAVTAWAVVAWIMWLVQPVQATAA